MGSTDVITLPKTADKLKNGLVLVFGRDGTYNYTSYYIPKEVITRYTEMKHCFLLSTSLLEYVGAKTLTITSGSIKGDESNTQKGTSANSGIIYNNQLFFLKFVYEV